MSISAILAGLKGLAIIAKLGTLLGGASSLLAFIPGGGVGQAVVAALSAIARGVAWLIASIFEGITICLANPVVFTVLGAVFCGGLYSGIEWDRHLVEKAARQITQVRKEAEQRVASVAEKISTESERKATEARGAADQVVPPGTPSEIEKACKASASCRDRGR